MNKLNDTNNSNITDFINTNYNKSHTNLRYLINPSIFEASNSLSYKHKKDISCNNYLDNLNTKSIKEGNRFNSISNTNLISKNNNNLSTKRSSEPMLQNLNSLKFVTKKASNNTSAAKLINTKITKKEINLKDFKLNSNSLNKDNSNENTINYNNSSSSTSNIEDILKNYSSSIDIANSNDKVINIINISNTYTIDNLTVNNLLSPNSDNSNKDCRNTIDNINNKKINLIINSYASNNSNANNNNNNKTSSSKSSKISCNNKVLKINKHNSNKEIINNNNNNNNSKFINSSFLNTFKKNLNINNKALNSKKSLNDIIFNNIKSAKYCNSKKIDFVNFASKINK